jgi:hypothetical protein
LLDEFVATRRELIGAARQTVGLIGIAGVELFHRAGGLFEARRLCLGAAGQVGIPMGDLGGSRADGLGHFLGAGHDILQMRNRGAGILLRI